MVTRIALDHIDRGGLVVAPMLADDDRTVNAAHRALKRAERRGVTTSYPLFGRLRYHRRAGSPPLGPQTLPTRFAVAQWAACSGATVLGPRELRDRLPWLDGVPDVAVTPTHITVLRCDLGGKPDHLVRKAVRVHDRLGDRPEYLALLAEGRFRVLILTATEEKAREIQHYARRAGCPCPIAPSIVPDFDRLLGRAAHA